MVGENFVIYSFSWLKKHLNCSHGWRKFVIYLSQLAKKKTLKYCPPWLEIFFEFTHLKLLNMHLILQILEKILEQKIYIVGRNFMIFMTFCQNFIMTFYDILEKTLTFQDF